jgi:hypothetical protein
MLLVAIHAINQMLLRRDPHGWLHERLVDNVRYHVTRVLNLGDQLYGWTMEDTEGGTYVTDKRVVCGNGNRAAPLIMGIILFGTPLRFLFLVWETPIVYVNARRVIIAFEPMRARCMNRIAAPRNRCAILIHFCRLHGRVYVRGVLIVVVDGTSNDVTVLAIVV